MTDRRRTDKPLLLVLVVAAVVRLFRLGHQSLWTDEWFSYNLCRQSLDVIWAKAVEDAVHPPLYYLLLHPIAERTASEVWLRLPSVVFGVAAVWLTYCLALDLTDRATALVATWLVALSSFQVYNSQETRMYAMLTCLGLAALWALWRGLNTGRWQSWAAFSAFSALSLYTNYLGVAIAVTALGAVATHWRRYRHALRSFSLSVAAVILLWLPWGLAMTQGGQGVHDRRRLGSVEIATQASGGALLDFTVGYWNGFNRFYNERPPLDTITLGVLVLGLLCAAVLLLVGACRPTQKGWSHWYLLHCLFGPFAIGFFVATQTHFKLPRYFVLGAPAVAILMASGLVWFFRRGRVWRLPLSVGLGMATLWSLTNYHLNWHYWRDDWRSAVTFMEERFEPGDVLLFNASWMYLQFSHYVERRGRDLWPTRGLPRGGHPPHEETEQEAARIVAGHTRVWLILCYDLAPDPESIVLKFLDRHAAFRGEWRLSGVKIRLYECSAKA